MELSEAIATCIGSARLMRMLAVMSADRLKEKVAEELQVAPSGCISHQQRSLLREEAVRESVCMVLSEKAVLNMLQRAKATPSSNTNNNNVDSIQQSKLAAAKANSKNCDEEPAAVTVSAVTSSAEQLKQAEQRGRRRASVLIAQDQLQYDIEQKRLAESNANRLTSAKLSAGVTDLSKSDMMMNNNSYKCIESADCTLISPTQTSTTCISDCEDCNDVLADNDAENDSDTDSVVRVPTTINSTAYDNNENNVNDNNVGHDDEHAGNDSDSDSSVVRTRTEAVAEDYENDEFNDSCEHHDNNQHDAVDVITNSNKDNSSSSAIANCDDANTSLSASGRVRFHETVVTAIHVTRNSYAAHELLRLFYTQDDLDCFQQEADEEESQLQQGEVEQTGATAAVNKPQSPKRHTRVMSLDFQEDDAGDDNYNMNTDHDHEHCDEVSLEFDCDF
eukprot:14852-Heterococcus_DN1.PRE.3